MDKGEAIIRLRNMVECLNSCLDNVCNENCEKCMLFYAQGNQNDAKEYLQMALDALEKEFDGAKNNIVEKEE